MESIDPKDFCSLIGWKTYVHEDDPVRVVDAFVEALDLCKPGFDAVNRTGGGRPAYRLAALLKIYIYVNRIPSSRRLEQEAQRNLELIWLTGRLAPDLKTIADFRKDNGGAITAVCSQFIALCRKMKAFSYAVVAIDGSKLKAPACEQAGIIALVPKPLTERQVGRQVRQTGLRQ